MQALAKSPDGYTFAIWQGGGMVPTLASTSSFLPLPPLTITLSGFQALSERHAPASPLAAILTRKVGDSAQHRLPGSNR